MSTVTTVSRLIEEQVSTKKANSEYANKKHMAVGYKEMAEINLQLSEICFAAESEVEKLSVNSKTEANTINGMQSG